MSASTQMSIFPQSINISENKSIFNIILKYFFMLKYVHYDRMGVTQTVGEREKKTEREREREGETPFICWFISQMSTRARTGPE